MHHHLGALENAGHAIVILRADWIELVIMTTRAADGQGHERLSHRVHLLVDDVHLEDGLVLQLVVRGAEQQKRRGREAFAPLGERSFG